MSGLKVMKIKKPINKCPNCYDPLPGKTVVTPTGVQVCCDLCVDGWMNGERQKGCLNLVAQLVAIINSSGFPILRTHVTTHVKIVEPEPSVVKTFER